MLVLSRKKLQTIVLPDLGITIKVLRSGGKTVKLGFEVPDNVQILRGEVWDASQQTASQTAAGGDTRGNAGDSGGSPVESAGSMEPASVELVDEICLHR